LRLKLSQGELPCQNHLFRLSAVDDIDIWLSIIKRAAHGFVQAKRAGMSTFYAIIPARYNSTRFPGKALADIAGKPMIRHVYERALQCPALASVTLATDDERIRRVAEEWGMRVVMTRPDHPSGTDRVYEAACALGVADDAVIVNVQGDEPLLDPAMLDELMAPFLAEGGETLSVSTLAVPLRMPRDARRLREPAQVKVVTAANDDALYFSRACIPHVREDDVWEDDVREDDVREDDGRNALFLGHIGLYAFRLRALARFVSLPPSRLEKLEKLEQLRFLENGIPIRVARTGRHCPGVDTPEDLERVRALMRAAAERR
jgi:3-deoxy-manno-octulosonate cytidylyltransferase (CMP-KDO synthetase)